MKSMLACLALATLPIGAAIPKADVKVKDVSGKELTLQEAKQTNGLLVMFTCNTCPYVIRNQSRTKDVCAYAQSNKIGVVLLNSNEGDRQGGNSFEEMQSYAKSQGYQWYYALDSKSVMADAFGASRTPECYLFDKSGKLVYHGAIDDSPGDAGQVKRHHLKEAIQEMMQGREVSVKETRSVGCSINRG
ncbi:MAG TPA: thioredoxin family protein [Puia sp.]|nr:thioredoxin family protein [Puia sp.]